MKKITCKEFRKGYAFERYNQARLRIGDTERATGIKWNVSNTVLIRDRLREFLIAHRSGQLSEYDRKYHQRPQENQIEKLGIPGTVGEAIKEFIAIKLPSANARNKQNYRSAILFYFNNETINLPLDHRILAKHIAEIHSGSKKKASTIEHYASFVSTIFNYCVDEEYMRRNPFRLAPPPKPERQIPQTYTSDEIDNMTKAIERIIDTGTELQQARYQEFLLLIRFLMATGMRISEALNLTVDNISYSSITFIGKGRRERSIPIEVLPDIKPILEKLLNLMYARNEKKWLFRWRTYRTVDLLFTRLKKQLGMPSRDRRQFHAFRKYAFKRWSNMGLSETIITELAGHTQEIFRTNYKIPKTIPELEAAIERELRPFSARVNGKQADTSGSNVKDRSVRNGRIMRKVRV